MGYKIPFYILFLLNIFGTYSTKLFKETKQPLCDIEINNDMCLLKGNKVLSPKGNPLDLLTYFNFNDDIIFDQTATKTPCKYKNIQVKPGMQGFGNSAGFEKNSHFLIENVPDLELQYSIEFQFYLENLEYIIDQGKDNSQKEFTIFEKFLPQSKSKNIMSIKLAVLAESKHLRLKYGVKNADGEYEEHQIKSKAKILQKRWTHIVIIREYNVLTLWVNGFKDNLITPKIPLFFGEQKNQQLIIGDLSRQSEFSELNYMHFQLDNFKIFDKSLLFYEIQAVAEQFLGGISPKQYLLDGFNKKAEQVKCNGEENYHVCSSFELLAGGYQVTRIMGWIDEKKPDIWSKEGISLALQEQDGQSEGLGLCCLDINYQ